MKMKSLLFVLPLLAVCFIASADAQVKRKPVTGKAVSAAKGIVSIEAGLVYKSGDVKPVARTEFYLLDSDLETILKDSGITVDNLVKNYVGQYTVLEYGARKYGIVKDDLTKARDAIKPHILATMTTDFNGKGSFTPIKTGKYFLMGVGGTDNQAVTWNVAIDLKTGSQSVILDNKNAEIF